MKKFFNLNLLLSGLLMAACAFTFTACSDDDDDNNGDGPLDKPTYADDAVKFEITDASSQYSSIELTASGDYIVEKALAGTYSAVKGFKALAPSTRATAKPESNSYIICGTYEKNADGSYTLKGFGKIEIGEQSIIITINNETKTTHAVKKSPKIDNMSSDLFRTWKAAKFRVIAKGDGYSEDKTFNSFDAMEKWLEDEEGPDDNPEEFWYQPTFEKVIVSQYGTFAISAREYFGNILVSDLFAPIRWTRIGTNSGKLSIDSYGDTTFELNNNQLVLTYDESDEEDIFKLVITYNPA